MAKSSMQLSRDAMRQIRNLPAVKADLKRRADRIAATASEGGRVSGYMVTPLTREKSRAAVSVMATGHAHSHNRRKNALMKALDSGRG